MSYEVLKIVKVKKLLKLEPEQKDFNRKLCYNQSAMSS